MASRGEDSTATWPSTYSAAGAAGLPQQRPVAGIGAQQDRGAAGGEPVEIGGLPRRIGRGQEAARRSGLHEGEHKPCDAAAGGRERHANVREGARSE